MLFCNANFLQKNVDFFVNTITRFKYGNFEPTFRFGNMNLFCVLYRFGEKIKCIIKTRLNFNLYNI